MYLSAANEMARRTTRCRVQSWWCWAGRKPPNTSPVGRLSVFSIRHALTHDGDVVNQQWGVGAKRRSRRERAIDSIYITPLNWSQAKAVSNTAPVALLAPVPSVRHQPAAERAVVSWFEVLFYLSSLFNDSGFSAIWHLKPEQLAKTLLARPLSDGGIHQTE